MTALKQGERHPLMIGDNESAAVGLSASNAFVMRNRWTAKPPEEQGYYWHWDGSEDSAPVIMSILYSGTESKCFIAIGQLGIETAIWCDKHGGYWKAIEEPRTPDKFELAIDAMDDA